MNEAIATSVYQRVQRLLSKNEHTLTAALPVLPDQFRQDIKVGGRMIAFIGDSPRIEAQLIRRTGERDWTTENLFETDMPCLANARQPERFEL